MKAYHRVVPRGEKTIKRYKSHVPYQWTQCTEHKSSVVHASPNSNSLHIICMSVEGKMQLYELDSVLSPSALWNPMLSQPAHRGSIKYFHSALHIVMPLSRLYSYTAIKFNSILENCALLGSHAACHHLRGGSLKSRNSVLQQPNGQLQKKTGNTLQV